MFLCMYVNVCPCACAYIRGKSPTFRLQTSLKVSIQALVTNLLYIKEIAVNIYNEIKQYKFD